MHHYLAFGLHIRSEIELPELIPGDGGGTPDVRIELGKVKHPGRWSPRRESRITSNEDGVFLFWKRVGSFHVRDGDLIVIHPARGVPEDTVRLPLLGVVLGTLLHQRGFLTLHASTVSMGTGGVAFLGWKGAGKSTTAAALNRMGHPVLTDDVLALVVDDSAENAIRVVPAFPQLKLWPATSRTLGMDPASLTALHPEIEKKAFRPRDSFSRESVPLLRIYALEDGPRIESVPLSRKDGLIQILSHSYAARFLGNEGAGAGHFKQCTRLVREIPVHLLRRPRDLDALNELARFVENDVSAVG